VACESSPQLASLDCQSDGTILQRRRLWHTPTRQSTLASVADCLVGLAEVAELLKVTKRTASAYSARPDFPTAPQATRCDSCVAKQRRRGLGGQHAASEKRPSEALALGSVAI